MVLAKAQRFNTNLWHNSLAKFKNEHNIGCATPMAKKIDRLFQSSGANNV